MATEITNITRSPVQIILRSQKPGSKQFTVKNIPGVGKGNNKFIVEDEQYTEFIDKVVAAKPRLVTTKKINIKKKY